MSGIKKHHQGVALVMVLMITAVLGLLMLQIGLTAKENVAKAQILVNRVMLDLEIRSREAELFHSLLTVPWGDSPDANDARASPWNFRGESFRIDQTDFRIQDVAGLLSFPSPQSSTEELANYLRVIGVEADRRQRVLASIRELQRLQLSDGRFVTLPLQSFGELAALPDLSQRELERLEQDMTLFSTGAFNPNTAPRSVMSAKFQEENAALLMELRDRENLDFEVMQRVTGQDWVEALTFWPGPVFRVDARIEKFGLVAHRETTVLILPHEKDPLIVLGQRRLQGRMSDGGSID